MSRAAPTTLSTTQPGRTRPPWGSRLRCAVVLTAAALAGATVTSACTRSDGPTTAALPDGGSALVAQVAEVTDGDTVTLSWPGLPPERARLIGLDTPETVKPNSPVECYGPEASARTKALLPAGTEVLVQRDVEARDRYGRLLVYLWRSSDNMFVNRALLADGYGTVLSIAPNTTRRAQMAEAERSARTAGRGLWGAGAAPGGR